MAKKKKPAKNSIARPKSANPPETLRDELTGKYLMNKQAAFRQWFKDAKNKTQNKCDVTKSIDPKQVIYNLNADKDDSKRKK